LIAEFSVWTSLSSLLCCALRLTPLTAKTLIVATIARAETVTISSTKLIPEHAVLFGRDGIEGGISFMKIKIKQ